MGTVPQAAQYTIKMLCRLENLGHLNVCDRECAWQTYIHINCVHIGTFQISFGVMFYTLERFLSNWSVFRMRTPHRSGGKTNILTVF